MSDNSAVIFNRTRRVLKRLRFALEKTENDKELKSYFTQYILVIFYSEFENKLKAALQKALTNHSKESLSHFISKAMDTVFKRIDKKELVRTIAYFGNDKKDKFKSLVKEPDFQRYQNFIENRHRVAHGDSISLSWEETKDMAEIGERIVAAVDKSLK